MSRTCRHSNKVTFDMDLMQVQRYSAIGGASGRSGLAFPRGNDGEPKMVARAELKRCELWSCARNTSLPWLIHTLKVCFSESPKASQGRKCESAVLKCGLWSESQQAMGARENSWPDGDVRVQQIVSTPTQTLPTSCIEMLLNQRRIWPLGKLRLIVANFGPRRCCAVNIDHRARLVRASPHQPNSFFWMRVWSGSSLISK